MRRRAIIGARCCVLVVVPFLLQACAEKPAAPRASGTPVFAADVTGGAKQCTVSKPVLKDGQDATATMQVGNDGGWCGISVARDGKSYAAGLLTVPAAHGRVFIHPVGDATRIDYTPDRGFAGPDSFTVKLIPGYPVLRVTVTVTR
jgi:hypothetical protein